MTEKEIELKIKQLPSAAQKEVMDFIEFLSARQHDTVARKKGFSFAWAGGLSGLAIGSVELQHKAMEWRS